MTKQLPAVNVGVDIGKSQLDLYLLERDRALRVPNDEQAIVSLIRRLSRYRIERIVIEATGRLEQPFVRAALAAGLPVVVVSPLKIRPSLAPHPTQTPKPSKTWSFVAGSSFRCAPWRRTGGKSCHKS